jgi:hypothetical protein
MPDPSPAAKALSPNARRGRRLFTTGAILLLLMGLVHSLSFINAPVPANETERQLLDLMSNYKFNLLGSMRSMNNLMTGFSISFMLAALGFAAPTSFLAAALFIFLFATLTLPSTSTASP